MKLLQRIAILIALPSSILLLSSCTQYRYDVTYEKCNGQTGSAIEYDSDGFYPASPPYYSDKTLYLETGVISNVCDFSYTRNPIE